MDAQQVATDAVNHHAALQKPAELAGLLEILDEVQPQVIIEIGVDAGGCLYAWSQLPGPPVVIAIDLAEGPFRACPGPPQLHGARLIAGDSHDMGIRNEVAVLLGERKADMLMIDGDHYYAGVKQDWLMYRSLVRDGGLVIFHDICDHPGDVIGVNRLWKEITPLWPNVEIVEPPFTWGGIGVLTLAHLPAPEPVRVPAR